MEAPASPLLADNLAALEAALSCLPPFPGQTLTATFDNLRNSYVWVFAMVQIYGESIRAWQATRAERKKPPRLTGLRFVAGKMLSKLFSISTACRDYTLIRFEDCLLKTWRDCRQPRDKYAF